MSMTIKAQKVIYADSVGSINEQISKGMTEGWTPLGSHQVVVSHEQLRYSGMQHKDTIVSKEYSQTMVMYDTDEVLSVKLYHYFDGDKKMYDIEYIKEEFNNKIADLIKN